MNNIISCKGLFYSVSFSTLTVLGNSLSAVAQTVNTTSSFQLTQSTEIEPSSSKVTTEVETSAPSIPSQTPVQSPVSDSSKNLIADVETSKPSTSAPSPIQSPVTQTKSASLGSRLGQWKQQLSTKIPQETANRVVTPIPGTTATSSVAFSSQYTQPTSEPSVPKTVPTVKPSGHRVAQSDISVTPGRVTRGGASYIGVAGNLGLSTGSGSALSDGNFTIISKIGLTNTISVRPSAVLGDNPAILIPITYDFNIGSLGDPFSEPLPIAPYIGAGVAIDTGNSGDAAFLLSVGLDVPLNRQFTATAAINTAFFGDPDVGLLIGVGYNFRGF